MFGYLFSVVLCPLRTNHHARIVMGLDVAVSAEALSDVQFGIVARSDCAIHYTRGAGIHPAHNDPECNGRWAQDPGALRMQTGGDLSAEPR